MLLESQQEKNDFPRCLNEMREWVYYSAHVPGKMDEVDNVYIDAL